MAARGIPAVVVELVKPSSSDSRAWRSSTNRGFGRIGASIA
jgi:hypothetical protein